MLILMEFKTLFDRVFMSMISRHESIFPTQTGPAYSIDFRFCLIKLLVINYIVL